ncbi:Phthiocerol synthesis polyketide synthase type I PpsC [Folsomia candida]|uniref:Phthiocerol synthesis polyketide synthase type I PpsC n=1 Tax=Folsomia candida TaxID=158441 RepID=A0A226D5C0_FOLCA|nr:Phthiocerol synthesis polyketide synthase type I PpsC [Folsomia candida]
MLALDIVWVDLDTNSDTTQRVNETIMEIRNRQKLRSRKEDSFVTYRDGVRYVGKFVPLVSHHTMLTLPQTENPIKLKLPKSCAIEDLQWDNSTIIGASPALNANQVEIRVHASAINFKDILNIIKPTLEFASASTIGADISGEVIGVGSAVRGLRIGANVLAMNMEPAPLPNVVIINASHVVQLPPRMTHIEGATLPTAFYTAYHCLVTVGNLSRGEWVLIHTASGSVGLVAIQIAREIGANIICTAGSRRKRAYLTHVIGLTNVTSSRDISSFLEGVRSATGNAGVHVVLNSLTSKGWKEASMSMTRIGGRFIEMSKLNIWSQIEVDQLRPDVKYLIVDLSVCDDSLISALKHLQRAAHIGKVEKTKDIFNQHSTYLVTGGCGGLGIELTKFMLLNGAKHIVLVSRRHEGKEAVLSKLDNRDAYVRYAKDELNGVIVEYGDISTQAGVNEILEKIYCLNMPPLRGVFHLAGVLADATIPNMTMEKLETVWAGKVAGAFTLHAATSRLNLEHFVLFSSANWILGGPGQANYSAANAALASLADFRHRLGLKAISIAWGRWGEIGMVRDLKRTVLGLKPFSTVSGINTMEHILRNSVMLGSNVMAAELSGDVKTSWLGHYVETVARVAAADLKVTDRQDRSELLPGNLKETVFKLVAKMLRISDPNKLNGAVLRDIGMDSLMRIELKNRLHRLYNVVVEVVDDLWCRLRPKLRSPLNSGLNFCSN